MVVRQEARFLLELAGQGDLMEAAQVAPQAPGMASDRVAGELGGAPQCLATPLEAARTPG